MGISKHGMPKNNLKVDEYSFKQVEEYKFLGVNITNKKQ